MAEAVAERVVEVRCPVGPRQLLMKLRQSGLAPSYSGDNLIELSCRDCARTARHTDPGVRRVLHRFALNGDLIESVVER